jgi:hypothetical protein
VQGAKYKRRWVEVTEHTFVYSPSQQDALTGHCSVFAIGDMVWVKADGDTKFMVRGGPAAAWPDSNAMDPALRQGC